MGSTSNNDQLNHSRIFLGLKHGIFPRYSYFIAVKIHSRKELEVKNKNIARRLPVWYPWKNQEHLIKSTKKIERNKFLLQGGRNSSLRK